MPRLYILLTILFFWLSALSQNNLGLPEIFNYSKHHYNAGTQNWGMAQDKNGIMYFANNEGLLSFDGIYWKIHPLPNKTNVRSVALGADGKIYVGGQDEIGYFYPDQSGQLQYHSLKELVPATDRSFADVWNIVLYKKDVFFRSTRRIMQLSGKSITTYPGNDWRFLGISNDLLIAQNSNKGLLYFTEGLWYLLGDPINNSDFLVTSFNSLNKDSSLLTTQKHGCFILSNKTFTRWSSPGILSISDKHISSSAIINGQVVLATNLDGCYVFDKKGNLITRFTRKEGLQNNNILSLFTDRDKNLWMGLDNGVDLISYNSAVKQIFPDSEKDVSGYAAYVHQNKIYFGTSNGLYAADLRKDDNIGLVVSSFLPVQNTKGQVWNLSKVNGQLLLGHHEGSFLVQNNTAIPLDKSSGYWGFLPFENVLPSSIIVAGNYNGISYFSYSNNKITHQKHVNFESSRFLLIDNKNVWMSHPYKGIFRVENDENNEYRHTIYGAEKGIPEPNNNFIFKIKNEVLATTSKGIYKYNAATDKFETSEYYNTLLPVKGIRYLKEDLNGNVWFVFNKTLGVLDFSGREPSITYISELDNKLVSGFEHVYPMDAKNIIVGGEQGFYLIDYDAYKKANTKLEASIRSVSIFNQRDSLLFGGFVSSSSQPPSVPYSWNTLHFDFASSLFSQQNNIEYSYQLAGFDDAWSAWSKKTFKEYTNLPAGKYDFKVKARTNLGTESAAVNYSFTVLPPWHKTRTAYTLYILLFGCLIYLAFFYQKKRFEQQQARHREEQAKLQYMHDLKLEHNEKVIIQLRNEKLEAEINHKNKDLATVAMHLVQKGELLSKIKDELVKTSANSIHEKVNESYKKLIKILNEEERKDEDWDHFAQYFDHVHSNFLLALKQKYQKLSSNELKLSAYIRMNLSTKEIAQLMNISVRGVEISRYRLRKKLMIPTEVSLVHFLMNFSLNNYNDAAHQSATNTETTLAPVAENES